MKKYILILVAIASLHSAAMAQKQVGAEVNVQKFEYDADSVTLNINFDFKELKVGANESVVFAPTIFKGDNRATLPTLVVRRRGGKQSYKRATTLDNQQSLETYAEWYGEPYEIIDNFGSKKQTSTSYSVTVPYEKWMVGSQLYVDCSTCGCCLQEDNGMIVPDDNTLLIDIPTVAPYAISPKVELIKPEKVAIKRRDVAYSSALIFRVNSTEIDPNLENNSYELAEIDEMMQSVISDSDYTITKVNITGFASPEGSYESNMKLSKGRATALERLMERKYESISKELYSVEFGGENWDKLYEIVEQSDMDLRDEVLDIIKNSSIEEGRERKLMSLDGGATYKYLLRNIFPATRLVVVNVEYNVDAYDLDRIAELIDTKPQNLSLEEIYRLSETFDMDDAEFEKIFLTAVNIYPDDEVAQNNALVTEIRRGNVEQVVDVAARADHNTSSPELANSLGVYYMIEGDYTMAESMLTRAVELGSSRAKDNMTELDAKLENLKRIRESEEFRMKIYGK